MLTPCGTTPSRQRHSNFCTAKVLPGPGEAHIHAAHICEETHPPTPTTPVMGPHTAKQHHICLLALLHNRSLSLMIGSTAQIANC